MCCVSGTNNNTGVIVCGVGAALLVSAITLLVVGILGLNSTINLSPLGSRILIGLGSGLIVGIIGTVVKFMCKS